MDGEKVVRRGEVWWIKSTDSFGHEWGAGRPAVVVSGDAGNKSCPTVIVAYTTTQPKPSMAINVRVLIDGVRNTVVCNAVTHVDKGRLERKIGTLTDAEMIRVGGALAVAMCIPQYSKPQPKQEEPADVVALRCERDMWQKMYEVVLAQLVNMRVAADTARKTVIVEKPVELPVVKQVPHPVKQDDLPSVDINHCSELALRELGLSDADVASVIGCRPFESVLELNCVPNLDTGWVAANEHRFICMPIVVEEPTKEPKKVNLNTCKPKDLREIGITQSLAYRIISDRKKNGPFALVGDVTRVQGIGQRWLDTWADKLEV